MDDRDGDRAFDVLRHGARGSPWRPGWPASFHRNRREPPDSRPRLPSADGGWIADQRRPFFDYAVGSLVPVAFERYIRVFHPAWSAAHEPIRWDAVAAWSGRTMHALAQWEFLSRPVTDTAQPPPFVAPPDAGGLPHEKLAALCDVLAGHTATPASCLVGVWEGCGWPVEAWADDVLDLEQRSFHVRRGPISIALEFGWQIAGSAFQFEPPTIAWPEDRAWFFASDPDLDSTYIGGSRALINGLVGSPELEVWPVDPSDHITIGSDGINAPGATRAGP